MKRAPTILVGDCVKRNEITREDVVNLAKAMFDGRRELPVGERGTSVVLKDFDSLTKHLQECLVTILLTSPAISARPDDAALDELEVEAQGI